jgi:hypothetical protein
MEGKEMARMIIEKKEIVLEASLQKVTMTSGRTTVLGVSSIQLSVRTAYCSKR